MAQNYGFLEGLANGANSFLNSYTTTKRLNHDQQMQEMASGVTRDENGNFVYTPEKQQEMQYKSALAKRGTGMLTGGSPESLETIHGLQKAFNAGPASRAGYQGPKGEDIFDENMSGQSAEDLAGKGLIGKDVSGEYGMLSKLMNPMAQAREEALGYQKHKDAVGAIANDKPTQQLLNGYQSMHNALAEYSNNPNSQSFHTLQNVMRMNAGSSNRSGVNERASQYATDTGIKKSEIMQFLTGEMGDINHESPEMVNAILKVAEGELGLKQHQAMQQIQKKAGTLQSVYNSPYTARFKPDYDNTLQSQFGQFDMDQTGKSTAAPIKYNPIKKEPGFLSNLLNSFSPQAQASDQTHLNKLSDEELYQNWLRLHPDQRGK